MARPRATVYYTDRQQLSLAELEVAQRFSSGRYAVSVVGMLKIIAAVALFVAGVGFLTAPACDDAPSWYGALPPALHLAAGVLLIAVYALFTLGFAQDSLDTWVKADMGILIVQLAMAVVGSALTLASCNDRNIMHLITSLAALAGALLLIVDLAALFVMWRYREEEDAGPQRAGSGLPVGAMPTERSPPRKSIFL